MKNSFIIVSQLNSNSKSENYSHQLSLPLALGRGQEKPQILRVPGTSPREKNRYRVMVRDRVIASRLTADEALEIAANLQICGEVDQ